MGVARTRMVLRPFLSVGVASTRGLTLEQTHGGSTGSDEWSACGYAVGTAA